MPVKTYNDVPITYNEPTIDYTGNSLGTLITKLLTDTVTLSENFVKSTVKLIANSITVTDTFLRSTIKFTTDSVSLTESITQLKAIFSWLKS